ncbi:hypothetical protein ACLQ3C_13425 [Gordonia sp. DT30]|uniref:hypothetical protein n=1 Tax=Gordonia sp. DT30 TaxID=3416546 RepID=UPI003CF84592
MFWQKVFTSRYDAVIWDSQIATVLPGDNVNGGSTARLRARVYSDLDRIRLLRNRIAHHEPIIFRDLAADLAAIKDLVQLRCTHTAHLLEEAESVTALLPQRPL